MQHINCRGLMSSDPHRTVGQSWSSSSGQAEGKAKPGESRRRTPNAPTALGSSEIYLGVGRGAWSPVSRPPPPEEACAIARAHKRRSAQKAQEENGSSVA